MPQLEILLQLLRSRFHLAACCSLIVFTLVVTEDVTSSIPPGVPESLRLTLVTRLRRCESSIYIL